MIKTLTIKYPISGTKIFLPFSAICSVTDKEFGGDIIIEYYPKTKVLEYADAETAVNRTAKKKLTAENLVYLVFSEVEKSIKPRHLKVLVEVKYSKAHKPVHVWLEKGKK